MPASSPNADRNLLFGVLALQMDFIGRDALVAAMNAWVLRKATPLGEILLEQGALRPDAHALLDALMQKHLEMHGGDAQKSLAAVSSVGSVRKEMEQIADEDLYATLSRVAADRVEEADPFATVGELTSSGLRFRILRPHARGGLGEVFVALDAELHREVALKEIQGRHADDLDSRARFILEAEITGGLEHPGIVPVYGLGQYADGRPYYAMRFIPGDSLQEAIARFHKADEKKRDLGERALALRQLLGRFVDVCDAIAYAHSRGVLHRDLKPGNVMLGPFGETLVVDWGLAKPMGNGTPEHNGSVRDRPLTPQSSGSAVATQMGSALGTPAYMPPEQAAGRLDQLGPASDVYSLGAILYCLLTGKPPFTGSDIGDILRRVQAGDFPAPRKVRHDVPAALEAVCLKALALRPEDRYGTPRALAADIEKWLADEPVGAWREPWRLRLGRWARRHQTLMAAVATGLLVTVLAAGSAAWWLDRLRTEQRRGVDSALAEVARLQRENRWSEARAALGQARGWLGEEGPKDLRDRLDQGERNLDLVARLDAIRLKRANLIAGRRDYEGADRGYEAAFRAAGLGEPGADVAAAAAWVSGSEVREALVAALDDWAICAADRDRRAWLLQVARQADPDPWRDRVRAPAVWEDIEALARLTAGREVEEQSPQLLAALGWRLMQLKGDAEPLLRGAQARHPSDFWINFQLGDTLKEKRQAGAEGYYRAALAVRPGTYVVHNNLSMALIDLGRCKEATAESSKAIELDPRDSAAHYNLGLALNGLGRPEEALAEYRKGLELDPNDIQAHLAFGNALSELGRRDEAAGAFRKAIELDPLNANAHYHLGNALRVQGKLDEAVAEYGRAIELAPKLAPAHFALGVVLNGLGRRVEAVSEYRKAIDFGLNRAQAHFVLGFTLNGMGRLDEAAVEYRKAIELDPRFVPAHNDLGAILYGRRCWAEAAAEYRKIIELDPRPILARNNLARCERMLAVEKKLPAILQGQAQPTDAAERVDLAEVCIGKKRYAAAARFYTDAFAAPSRLADDPDSGHRYRAACSAALAAAGQGEEAPHLNDKECARLRRQAREWLQSDLALRSQQMKNGTPQERAAAQRMLRQWQRNADLAGLRDAAALDKLPEDERADWRKLWDDVAALLKQ